MTSVTENGRKLDEISNFRPLSVSSPIRGFLQMSFEVPFLLSLLVIHLKYLLWLPLLKDERIERVLGEQKPSLANFLKASKYYYFDRYVQKSRI